MTEYTNYDNTPLTEITNNHDRGAYFEQARKELQNRNYNMSYLPLAKDAPSGLLLFDLTMETYSSSRNTVNEDIIIVQKTLEKTFEVADSKQASDLIFSIGNYSSNQSTYHDILKNCIMQKTQESPDWINRLTPQAKFITASLFGGNFSALENKDFLKMDYPKTDSPEYYQIVVAAQKMLEKENLFRTNKYSYPNRSTRPLSWALKAEAMEATLKAEANLNNPIISDAFLDLVDTADKQYGNTRECVKKLTSIAEKMSESFDFIHNRAFGDVSKSFASWAGKIPPCEETQQFYYVCMKKLHCPENIQFDGRNINAGAFNKARAELDADNKMDDIIRNKTKNINTSDLLPIANFRLDRLLKYDGLSAQGKLNLLQLTNYGENNRIPEKKQLQLMIEVMKERPSDVEVIDGFLRRLKGMKTVSGSEIKECMTLVGEQVVLHQKEQKKEQEVIAQYQKANQAALDAKTKYENTNSTYNTFSDLCSAVVELKNKRKDKEENLSPDALDQLLMNAINGKEPKHLEYKENEGLSKLFTGKDEKARQAEISSTVRCINTCLRNLETQNNQDILKELKSPKINLESLNELGIMKKETTQNRNETQNTLNDFYSINNSFKIVNDYENKKLSERYKEICEEFKTRKTQKTEKAKESLSMKMGQDFNAPTPLAEVEKRSQEFYKKKTKELTAKIKENVTNDMEQRGVFEKPDLENPDQTGTKMTKENTAQARKMMKDKKIYESLISKDK